MGSGDVENANPEDREVIQKASKNHRIVRVPVSGIDNTIEYETKEESL